MSTKIILNIQDNIHPELAARRVAQVVEQGRVSNNRKNYCYVTTFMDGICVQAKKNKKSDTFTVVKTTE